MKGLMKTRTLSNRILLLLCCLLAAAAVTAGSAMPSFAASNKTAPASSAFTGAKKASGGSWVKKSGHTRYRKKDGSYARNEWLRIKDQVYYFGTDKNMAVGWITYDGHTYYAGENGAVASSTWVREGKNQYYLRSNGICCSSEWAKIKGRYYYFLENRTMARNRFIGDYYVAKDGFRLASTWLLTRSGYKYYLGKDGKRLKKTWLRSGGRMYYLKADGKMAVSEWITLPGGMYYVNARGARLANCEVDGYYLDATGKRTVKVFKGSRIFVGDSRFVGMEMAIGKSADNLFIAKVSMGYDWLSSYAGPLLQQYVAANPGVKVILGLGINDLGNLQKYITYYNSLIHKFPNTSFYVLSVNPVVESRWPSVRNESVRRFNAGIQSGVSAHYLNCYAQMVKKGFRTVDGLHYTTATYQFIYQYIIKKIKA